MPHCQLLRRQVLRKLVKTLILNLRRIVKKRPSWRRFCSVGEAIGITRGRVK